jgi:parallel beta-helix repeat protein
MVLPGTYVENIDFLGRAITLISEQGPDTTIIDGNQAGSVVTFSHDEGPDSKIEGFTIRNGMSTRGGGISCIGSSPLISNNIISGNIVTGAQGHGGGVYLHVYSSPAITDNIISENSADQFGGGIYCNYYSSPTISGNTIAFNTAGEGSGLFFLNWATPIVHNNIISDNFANDGPGGGIYCEFYSSLTLSSNTITRNFSYSNGGGIWCNSSYPTITNCILWDNSPDEIFVNSGDPTVSYSDVEGGWEGIGNINSYPLFFNPDNSDFYLRQDPPQPGVSNPCVDSGDPNSPMIDGTTRTDGVQDEGIIDMGYHYQLSGVNLHPFSHFDWAPTYPETNETILFDASESYDLDGNIVLYEWDWDSDGIFEESHTIPITTYSWETFGNYPVTMRGTDDDGASDKITRMVDVAVDVLYVGDGPGSYNTIQDAIADAVEGVRIVVMPDTYYENINFIGKSISIVSDQGADVTIIDGNQAGSVVTFEGGEGADSRIVGFTLTNGNASFGGGIYCGGSSPTITHNIITGNIVETSGGGIICTESSSPSIINNIVVGNSAGVYGGGIHCYDDSDPIISNNTLTGNSAGDRGGGIGSRFSDPTVTNCILWDNSPDEIYRSSSGIVVTYSDVQGGFTGEGNIDADPQLLSFHGFDYLLGRTSPCIDSGDPLIKDGFDWPGLYHNSSRSDMGVYGGPDDVGWFLD